MRLKFENPYFPERGLHVIKQEHPCFDSDWHYHPEYELMFKSRSCGIRYVGDNVSPFSPGELVLIGPYLPHLWRNDPTCCGKGKNDQVLTIVINFTKDFIGHETFNNPEFQAINTLLELSNYGVHFDSKTSNELKDELICFPDLSPADQCIKLLSILNTLSKVENRKVLSVTDMRQSVLERSKRIDSVIKYISDHYSDNLRLEDIADIACMTTNSFCRFFKKATNKSFTQFLNEVRVKNASRLLKQDDLQIANVCYMVGYSSISNFNKQFKQIMQVTPNEYRSSNGAKIVNGLVSSLRKAV